MLKQQLQEAIESGDALFLVGTGVSVGATKGEPLASWIGLIENGIAECVGLARVSDAKAKIYRQLLNPDIADTNDLITAAEFVTTNLKGPGGGDFKGWLRKSIGSLRAEYKDVLEALRDLPGLIATTNYDELLEEVTKLREVTWREGNEVELVLKGREKGILHLHGFWRDAESVVLGIRSYEEVLRDPHAQTMLRTILATKTVIFVGCGEGVSDPNFGALLDWARPVFAGSERVHYRLALEGEADKLRKQHKDDRIMVVPYGADFSALAPFLHSLVPKGGPGPAGSRGGTGSSAGGTLLASEAFPKLEDALIMRPFRDISALRELAKLLQEARLPWELLNRKFWRSVPESWRGELAGSAASEVERCANLVDVLSRFGAQSSRGRTFPLLEFVLRVCLAPECGAAKGDLRAWLKRNALLMEVDEASVTAEEQRLIGALYLLVKLEHASSDSLLVQAWLGDDTEARLQPLLDADKPLRREEIPAALGKLWTSQGLLGERLRIVDPSKLTLEFILPHELLSSLAVDEWKIPPGETGVRIGSRCRVVVRPLERVYASVRTNLEEKFLEASIHWERRWNVLLQQAKKPKSVVWVMSPDDHPQTQLQARLIRKEVVCLALALTSPQSPEEIRRQVLQLSILHGIPIALWSRQASTAPDDVKKSFKPLLAKLRELPDAAREFRWKALKAADPSHPGHHMTLLWDDPRRVPPDARRDADLHAPALI
jgi:hypothetical protein